jgi:hypothetical protein
MSSDTTEQDPDDSFAVPQSVPQWAQLPDYAQRELAVCGYDAAWFASQAQAPIMRLTVLNLYVKLKGLDLWRYVGKETDSQPGCLHVLLTAAEELKALLRERDDFTNPQDSPDSWDSREKRADGALHFKHFAGWPEAKVQAHIDPHGLLLHSPLWWLMPVIPLGQMLAHAADPTGYTEVYAIRDLLLDQGWDKAPLTGTG